VTLSAKTAFARWSAAPAVTDNCRSGTASLINGHPGKVRSTRLDHSIETVLVTLSSFGRRCKAIPCGSRPQTVREKPRFRWAAKRQNLAVILFRLLAVSSPGICCLQRLNQEPAFSAGQAGKCILDIRLVWNLLRSGRQGSWTTSFQPLGNGTQIFSQMPI